MRRTNWLNHFRDNRGGTIVEFALTLPLLLLLCLGTTDFGRLFFNAVTIANAAATGAFYGAQNNVNFSKFGMMANRVTDDAKNVGAVSASAANFCECPGSPPTDISCSEATRIAKHAETTATHVPTCAPQLCTPFRHSWHTLAFRTK